jgi:hypothetical protein
MTEEQDGAAMAKLAKVLWFAEFVGTRCRPVTVAPAPETVTMLTAVVMSSMTIFDLLPSPKNFSGIPTTGNSNEWGTQRTPTSVAPTRPWSNKSRQPYEHQPACRIRS